MASRQTTARVNHPKGGDLTVQHSETDSPLINVEQLEKLHSFRPDAVDWVMKQTQAESEHRRLERAKVNNFIFVEHLVGQGCAVLIGVSGIVGGAYVAINGQPVAGGTIATAAIGSLAIAFLKGSGKS